MVAEWFFIVAGGVMIVRSILGTSPFVNDVDGFPEREKDEDKNKVRPPALRDKIVYGLIGCAALAYGLYGMMHH